MSVVETLRKLVEQLKEDGYSVRWIALLYEVGVHVYEPDMIGVCEHWVGDEWYACLEGLVNDVLRELKNIDIEVDLEDMSYTVGVNAPDELLIIEVRDKDDYHLVFAWRRT